MPRKFKVSDSQIRDRGSVAVNMRALDWLERQKRGEPIFLEDTREFPVGVDLLDKVDSRYDQEDLYLSTKIKRYAEEEGVQVSDVISAMLGGEDLGRQTVGRFLTNTGLRPLFSPIVEDGLRLGLERVAPNWRGLIAREIPVDSMKYEYFEFDNGTPNVNNPGSPLGPVTDEFRLSRVAQGAPIPVARVSTSGKSYALYKSGRGIEWTDEAKDAPIDLAQLWFEQVGMQLGWDYFETIIEMLLNGYFPDGSDAAPVIPTATPGTITDADLYTALGVHQTVYGHTPDTMIYGLTTQIALRTMENGAGQRLFPNGLQAAGLPNDMLAWNVPADKILFVDSSFALMRLVKKEFGTEFDRDPRIQVEGVYGTEISIVVPFAKNARVILDS